MEGSVESQDDIFVGPKEYTELRHEWMGNSRDYRQVNLHKQQDGTQNYGLNTEDGKSYRLDEVWIKCVMKSSGNYVWMVSDGGLYLVDYVGCLGVEYNESGTSPTLTDRCMELRQELQF